MLDSLKMYFEDAEHAHRTIIGLILVIVLMVGLIIGFVGGTIVASDIYQQKVEHQLQLHNN